MHKTQKIFRVFAKFVCSLMVLVMFILLAGCCPFLCGQEDRATELVRYTVHRIDLNQPFADGVRDSWRWHVIALEDMLNSADNTDAQTLELSEVPVPPVEGGYTLRNYWLISDDQVIAQYQAPQKIADGTGAYRLYEQITVADRSDSSMTLAVWDYVLEVPGSYDNSAIFERFASYTVFGTTTIGTDSIRPSAQIRLAANDLQEIVLAARENLSSATLLAANQVPTPQNVNTRCSCCAYTKVVNGVVESYWGDPFAPGCGSCGTKIESYTVVIDGVLYEDVINAWDYRR